MIESGLFKGDHGDIPMETRSALIQLLKGPAVDGQLTPKLWDVIFRDQILIRKQLNNMLLQLVIDNDRQIAFVENADTEGPTLLRKNSFTLRDTALLLYLRAQLVASDSDDQRCVLDRSALVEHLRAYIPADESDLVRFDKQSEAAIERFITKFNLLHKLKGVENRLEVSQVLRVRFSVTEIEQLIVSFQKLRAGEASVQADPNDAEQAELTPTTSTDPADTEQA